MLPIGMDTPHQRTPWVNYFLIFLNIGIFFVTYNFPSSHSYRNQDQILKDWAIMYELFPLNPDLFQFISYAFLHSGWAHLLGNMFFLYMFGNNVNEKLGSIGYVLLYLGGAVFSGIGHAVFSHAPVIGASGAVAAVTGAFMVLFPNTYLKVLYYLFFFVGVIEIRALYFILLKLIILDNWLMPKLTHMPTNIAFCAHIAGYIYGIVIPLVLLATHLLEHSQYDLWALIKRWQQRQRFRHLTAEGYDPFSRQGRLKVDAKISDNLDPEDKEKIRRLRDKLSDALTQRNLGQAADYYLEMTAIDENQVLAEQPQLDIANKLMHNGQHRQAAQAYERFLTQYPHYTFIEQIHLMVGLIYARYLQNPEKAVFYLQAALESLNDPGQKQMCREELERLEKR